MLKKIPKGFIHTSAAFTVPPSKIKYYQYIEKKPEVGDIIYGSIERIGQHSSLENRSGRIHMIHNGTKAVFVFGNRYAPDYYEAVIPETFFEENDLIARSGLIGTVKTKKTTIKDPTRVKILGFICNEKKEILNSCSFSKIFPKITNKKFPRAKMILICGTSMNSGKTMAAVACCWALSSLGYSVRASKITGTASLKDILHMNDAGASTYTDFSWLGFPSTYLLKEESLLDIFNFLDLKYANNPQNFWVVELADGIIQRETGYLLNSKDVKSRIHKLIFSAYDAFGAIGGLKILKEQFNLVPDAISGICSSSPLLMRELSNFTNIPIFNSLNVDGPFLNKILLKKTIKL